MHCSTGPRHLLNSTTSDLREVKLQTAPGRCYGNRKMEDWSLISHLKNHPVDGDLFLLAPSQNWDALSSPGLFKTWGGSRGGQWPNGSTANCFRFNDSVQADLDLTKSYQVQKQRHGCDANLFI